MAAASDAEAGGGVAVDDEVGGEALVLLVAGDVAQFGHGLHLGSGNCGAQRLNSLEVFVGEGVLVLSGAAAAADLDTPAGPEEK